MALTLVHTEDDSISVSYNDKPLFQYTYAPREAALESPKPFLHPINSLAGELISLYRPHDHIWHKGLYLGISNFGDHNVWGGHTFLPGQGYRTREDHGRISHLGFDRLDVTDGVLRVVERLRWEGAGEPAPLAPFPPVDERRKLTGRVFADAGAWVLDFDSVLTNRSEQTIVLGSPTTKGRPAAGYGGLFWRGPRSFTETSEVVVENGVGGDELMGYEGAWMAVRGKHDGAGNGSTLLFADLRGDERLPSRWFVRVNPYACMGTAPFYDEEFDFLAGDTIRLNYRIIVADGLLDPSDCAKLVHTTEETS